MQSDELVEKAVKSAMLSVIKEHPMGHWRDDQVKEVARRAIVEAALSAAEPVAWVDAQELRYLQMVSGNKAWGDFQRNINVGGEKEGRSSLYAAPTAPSVAVPQALVNVATAVLAQAPETASYFMGIRLDDIRSALSAQVQEVAGWQRITIETGRKSGTSHADVWPDGEGWGIDTDRGRVNTPDAGWDRFSHHEELYFRRRANDLPAAPAKQEGCESKPVHKPTVDSGESGDE